MSVATKVRLEEFLSHPDIHYYDFNELHNGEVVVVSPPSDAHVDLQIRLEKELQSLLSSSGYLVAREFYCTLASNSRRVDVAAVLQSRRHVIPGKVFRGGPDLVIEILSPSNTALDLDKLRFECFEENTRQFWVINPDLKTVTVFTRFNTAAVYGTNNTDIPLSDFVSGAVLKVDPIFPLAQQTS